MRHTNGLKYMRAIAPTWTLDQKATYIVAGGFGGLGRTVLRWMCDRGAKTILVLSRAAPSSRWLPEMTSYAQARGVNLVTKACNIADEKSLTDALSFAETTLPRIKGCINSTMLIRVRVPREPT